MDYRDMRGPYAAMHGEAYQQYWNSQHKPSGHAQSSGHPVFRIPSNDDHERISALFLGPKAENHELLRRCFDKIVSKLSAGRQAYFPEDPSFITHDLQKQPAYVAKVQEIEDKLDELLDNLNKCSIPFYSPRYSAHMTVDQTLPAILGYMATMFYNPNNVAFEASPYTTRLELIVGQEMSEMMGYKTKEHADDLVGAWGHITCDGTVANLEAIWASRNLKFYPLSLRDAMAEGRNLEFISGTFKVTTCQGDNKLLSECSVWEMLNLPVSEVLDIPDRLYKEYNMSSTFLENMLKDYLVQTIGKDVLMQRWSIKEQPTVVVPSTKHYSWPKGAALTGIGSENCINIQVDVEARMDMLKLQDYLKDCLEKQRAVFEVVAVIGTTEEGAVDRLDEIVKMRSEFQKKGLSFAIHADAAWGGYFASMLLPEPRKSPYGTPFVPHVGLRKDTIPHLRALRDADSITIDPHKAGYVPYPAGGLCYKDGRMRYMVTWTAPYIDQGSTGENIGVYGVEGSKPGAAASAVYLAHQVIGTGNDGYGVLLGEASFTCRRFAAEWATMSNENSPYIVVPLNRLPTELDPSSTPKDVEEEKEFIRERILVVENSLLVQDAKAMECLNKLGSDLNINAFACNFRYKDGTVNKDIEEANWLNRRIFERLSVTSPHEDPLSIPFYLTSTTFTEEDYGECVRSFKKRLGLEGSQDLFVLRNVVMSPFTTSHAFVGELADIFQMVLEEEVENVIRRNTDKPGKHTFNMQGTDKLYLVHQPSFHMASGRRQIILSADISADGMKRYANAKKNSSSLACVVLSNVNDMRLDEIVDGKNFKATVSFPEDDSIDDFSVDVTNVKIVKKRSLDSEDFDSSYPALMPFYLYGTTAQPHIDHMLLLAPNIQLSAGSVKLELRGGPISVSDDDLAKGVIAVATNVHENSMQPFAIMKSSAPPDSEVRVPESFFFQEGFKMDVTIYRDPFPTSTMDRISMEDVKEKLGGGSITIMGDIYVDSDKLNGDKEIPERRMYTRHDLCNPMSHQAKKDWVNAVDKMHRGMKNMATMDFD